MSKTKITYKKPRGGDGFGKKIHHYKKFDRLTERQQKDLLDKFLDETEGLNDSQLTKKVRDFLEAHGITINNQVITEIKIMIFQDRMKPKVALMSPEVREKLKQADACNVLEAVYPFDRVASLVPFESYGKIKAFEVKPSLADLQKYFREDTAKERDAVLTSWDKYYSIVSYDYALDYHPSAMSHGLVSIVMHCGSDPWTFAHVIANTRLIFSDEIDWVLNNLRSKEPQIS